MGGRQQKNLSEQGGSLEYFSIPNPSLKMIPEIDQEGSCSQPPVNDDQEGSCSQPPVNDDQEASSSSSYVKFSPSDTEILEDYLTKKIKNPETLPPNCPITELINFYEHHPWDLLKQEKKAYFFTRPSNGNRSSEIGHWKLKSRKTERIGEHPSIPDVKVAVKRQLAFYDADGVTSSGFFMYEYQFDHEEYKRSFLNIEKKIMMFDLNSSPENMEELDDDDDDGDWVICEVYGSPRDYINITEEEIVHFTNVCIDAKKNL